MRSRLLPLLLIVVLPSRVLAQRDEEYHTTIVALSPFVAGQLASEFSDQREKLWCVAQWDSTAARTPRGQPFTLLTVTEIRLESDVVSSPRNVHTDDAKCRRPDKTPLPMIHTHPTGTCQASPTDNETILMRAAPFDGILCGDRFTVWYFYPQLLAVVQQNAQAWASQKALSASKP